MADFKRASTTDEQIAEAISQGLLTFTAGLALRQRKLELERVESHASPW